MKHKNLEKAVLLTVMLMSFHGGVEAAAVTNDDINTDTMVTVDSITANDGNEHIVSGNGDLTVNYNFKNGTAVEANSGSAIHFNNPDTTVTASNSENGLKADNATITFDDGAKLTVNFNSTANGIYVTGNNGQFTVGAAGAKIESSGLSNEPLQKGIFQESGTFTANGKLNIDLSSSPAAYLIGIDMRTALNQNKPVMNITGADITLHGKTIDAAGILNQGGTLTATDKLTINVSGGTNSNYGIDVGSVFEETHTNIKDAEITVTSSGNGSAAGIFSRNGSELTADKLYITANGTGSQNIGIYTHTKEDSTVEFNGGTLTVNNGTSGYGIKALGGAVTSNGDLTITAEGATTNFAVLAENAGTNINLNGSTNITSKGSAAAFGLVSGIGATVNSTGKATVVAGGGTASNVGVYGNGGNLNVNDVDVTVSGNSAIGVYAKQGKNNSTGELFDAQVNIKGTAVVNSATTAYAINEGSGITFEKSLIADNGTASQILASAGGAVNINSTGEGTVIYRGVTRFVDDVDNTINMNLNNAQSVWNLTGNSELTDFNSANDSLLDMTQDSGAYSNVTVNGNMTGNGGIIKMDIDETKNTNNSDRLYVNGTHSGIHYIDINPGGTNFDGESAIGTVLVSVGTETGEFKAKDSEGALFWNSYDLTQQNSTTGGYTKDWVVSEWTQKDEPTTSVDTILGANALNYHTWRAENDQLMRRMGELRNNGADEEGAWFRVHGSKINRDDSMSFENKYTTYDLGYDQITKQTEDMTRYTGAALSYTDGSGTYERGNGENHSKAIAFYNTDIYNSGHYLDLVFKYANMDNDFNVYDTNNNKISGEYKNTGISVSAEYGRKNDLKNGWYVEPQAQLTLGYFGGDEYETSNGISVDQSGIASVLGRVGFNIGKQIGDSGVIYAKANLLHEFAGDYDIDMYDGAGNHRAESASFNDTWFEYGVGAALKTGKNNHLYFDFVKTAGGDFEKDWQWNAGMRWTF